MKIRSKVSVLLMSWIFTILLSGCKVNVDTVLNISEDLTGERIMTYSIGKDYVPHEQRDKVELIKQKIDESHPEELEYSVVEDENNYIHVFKLTFNSLEEYEKKVESLVGRDVEIVVEMPDTVFASGVNITEDFESSELTTWVQPLIDEYNESQEYADDDVIKIGQLGDYLHSSSNLVYVENVQYETSPHIYINELEEKPLEYVSIQTFLEDDRLLREIHYGVSEKLFISNTEEIKKYMNSLVPTGATTIWEESGSNIIFKILMEAKTMEELGAMTRFALSSSNYSINDENLFSENLFIEQTTYHEHIDLSAFSSDEGIDISYGVVSRADQMELIEFSDGQTKVGSIWESDNGKSFDIVFGLEKQYHPDNVVYETNILNKDMIGKTLVFEYGQDTPIYLVDKVKNYFDGYRSEYITTEIINNSSGGNSVIVSIVGTIDVINPILFNLIGEGNSIQYKIDEESKILTRYEFDEHINLENLFSHNLKDILYKITSQNNESIKHITVKNKENGYKFYTEEKLPFENTHVSNIHARYEASKVNVMAVVINVLISLFILGCILVGIHTLIKTLAKKDNIEDKPFKELLLYYLKVVLIKIKDNVVKYSPIVLAFMIKLMKMLWIKLQDIYLILKDAGIPNEERREIKEYFYGHRWPKILCILTILQIPNLVGILIEESFMIRNAELGIIFTMMGFIISGIGYIVDIFDRNAEKEELIDLAMAEDMKEFTQRALDKLGLVSESISLIEPIKVTGPYYSNKDQEQESGYIVIVWNWLKTAWTYKARLILKRGSDYKVRYSLLQAHVFMYSESQIYVYCVSYDVCTGEIFEEETTEYFYQNVQCIQTGQSLYKISQDGKKVKQHYEYFKVTMKSGIYNQAVVEGIDSVLSNQIMAMKSLVREKKMGTKLYGGKENE